MIKNAGGIANQFMGDGVMAPLGWARPYGRMPTRLLAASAMIRSLAELTQTLADELSEPLRIRRLHTGQPLSGMAMPRRPISAVGDTVHVASRLRGSGILLPNGALEQVAMCGGSTSQRIHAMR